MINNIWNPRTVFFELQDRCFPSESVAVHTGARASRRSSMAARFWRQAARCSGVSPRGPLADETTVTSQSADTRNLLIASVDLFF